MLLIGRFWRNCRMMVGWLMLSWCVGLVFLYCYVCVGYVFLKKLVWFLVIVFFWMKNSLVMMLLFLWWLVCIVRLKLIWLFLSRLWSVGCWCVRVICFLGRLIFFLCVCCWICRFFRILLFVSWWLFWMLIVCVLFWLFVVLRMNWLFWLICNGKEYLVGGVVCCDIFFLLK